MIVHYSMLEVCRLTPNSVLTFFRRICCGDVIVFSYLKNFWRIYHGVIALHSAGGMYKVMLDNFVLQVCM